MSPFCVVMDRCLFDAYHATRYQILAQPPINLRIGQASPELDAWLDRQGARHAAFLTAWNPRSQLLSPRQNALRQTQLERQLSDQDLPYAPALGVPDQPGWTAETSVVISAIDRPHAEQLAEAFEQYGWLWLTAGEPVELVLTHWATAHHG